MDRDNPGEVGGGVDDSRCNRACIDGPVSLQQKVRQPARATVELEWSVHRLFNGVTVERLINTLVKEDRSRREPKFYNPQASEEWKHIVLWISYVCESFRLNLMTMFNAICLIRQLRNRSQSKCTN